MGIANTTPATALCSVYQDTPVASLTGRGTGIAPVDRKHDTVCKQHVSREYCDKTELTSTLGCDTAVFLILEVFPFFTTLMLSFVLYVVFV